MIRSASLAALAVSGLGLIAPSSATAHLGDYCWHRPHSHIVGLYKVEFVRHYFKIASPTRLYHVHVTRVDTPFTSPTRNTIICGERSRIR